MQDKNRESVGCSYKANDSETRDSCFFCTEEHLHRVENICSAIKHGHRCNQKKHLEHFCLEMMLREKSRQPTLSVDASRAHASVVADALFSSDVL